MSTEQRGIVTSLHEKDWNGTMLYSFKLGDAARYWRLGQEQPPFDIGECIKFTERNSNVDVASIEKVASIPEDFTPTATAVPTVNVGARIQYQAARADATRLVVAALHTDALPWTAAQVKNKSKKLDLLTGYIKQVTETLLAQEEKEI